MAIYYGNQKVAPSGIDKVYYGNTLKYQRAAVNDMCIIHENSSNFTVYIKLKSDNSIVKTSPAGTGENIYYNSSTQYAVMGNYAGKLHWSANTSESDSTAHTQTLTASDLSERCSNYYKRSNNKALFVGLHPVESYNVVMPINAPAE